MTRSVVVVPSVLVSALAMMIRTGVHCVWPALAAKSTSAVHWVHEAGFEVALKWPETHLHVRSLVVVGASSSSTVASLHLFTDWQVAAPALALKVSEPAAVLHAVHEVPAPFRASYPALHSHTRLATFDSALSSCTLASPHDRAVAHALALVSRYSSAPASHAVPHELSVVL